MLSDAEKVLFEGNYSCLGSKIFPCVVKFEDSAIPCLRIGVLHICSTLAKVQLYRHFLGHALFDFYQYWWDLRRSLYLHDSPGLSDCLNVPSVLTGVAMDIDGQQYI